MLTRTQLAALYPRAPAAHLDAFVEQHALLFEEFGIAAGRNRLLFFLAQIGHESGGLTIAEENLNYSAARLMAVWPSRFRTLDSARPFANDAQKLANQVYAARMGNGPPASGDGWRFRGRGYAQITGRDGYQAVGAVARIDLIADPDAAARPATSLRVACAFWQWKGLAPSADRGDFIANTKRWNGGTIGMDERWHWLREVQRLVPLSGATSTDETPLIDHDTIIKVQRVLKDHRLYDGSLDGVIGSRSRAGLRAWQAERGLPVDGEISAQTLDSMADAFAALA